MARSPDGGRSVVSVPALPGARPAGVHLSPGWFLVLAPTPAAVRAATRRLAAPLAFLAGTVVLAVAPATVADAATPAVSIGGGFATRAGYTTQGGIYTPHVSVAPCGSGDDVEVREFTTTVTRDGERVARTSRQFALLRVDPGRYQVATTLRYAVGGTTRTTTRTQTVTVTRKTDATSVSRPEFAAVRTGMTRAQVRRIVGGPGQEEDGTLWMDGLRFEHTVAIVFRDGRVSQKWDTRNVYDWC